MSKPTLRIMDTAVDLTPAQYGLDRTLYERKHVCEQLNLGVTKIHQLVNAGELNAIKVGRKTVFAAIDIAAYLNRARQAQFTKTVTPDPYRHRRFAKAS